MQDKELQIMFFSRALSEEEARAIYEGRIKPLRCRRCNLYFVTRSELMHHIWIHRR
jgi:hypothetical protein